MTTKLKVKLGNETVWKEIEAHHCGGGVSAEVYQYQEYALKVLHDAGKREQFNRSIAKAKQSLAENASEAQHFVAMYELGEVEMDNPSTVSPALQMEYVGNDLRRIVTNLQNLGIRENSTPKNKNILRALAYTTLLNTLDGTSAIIHGDLLPPNVLVKGVEVERQNLEQLMELLVNPIVKMTDFRMSYHLRTMSIGEATSNAGFLLPLPQQKLEEIAKDEKNLEELDKKNDVHGAVSIFAWLLSVPQGELQWGERTDLNGHFDEYEARFDPVDRDVVKEAIASGRKGYSTLDAAAARTAVLSTIESKIQTDQNLRFLFNYFVIDQAEGCWRVLRPADYLKMEYQNEDKLPKNENSLNILKRDYDAIVTRAEGDERTELQQNYNDILERVKKYCGDEITQKTGHKTKLEKDLGDLRTKANALQQELAPLDRAVKDYQEQLKVHTQAVIDLTSNPSGTAGDLTTPTAPDTGKYRNFRQQLADFQNDIRIKTDEVAEINKQITHYETIRKKAEIQKIK